MRNSAPVQAQTDLSVSEKLNAHFTLLRHLTVRLGGTVGGQVRGQSSLFTGTGVIVGVDQNTTVVLTAKHNLHVAGAPGNVAEGELVNYFKAQVRSYYTQPAGPEVAGTITDIAFPGGTVASAGYDVAVLRINDAAYAQAVRDLVPRDSARARYATEGWRGNGRMILASRDRAEARGVLMNGRPFPGPVAADQQNHLLLQFGHGKTAANGGFAFGMRALRTPDLGHPTYMDASHEGMLDVFTFDATDATTTTYEGDSGGPVFAVDPSGASSFLIGVALGANYYANRTDDNANSPIANNAITVLVSERIPLR